MIFDMDEESLLPADYTCPTLRASRQYHTDRPIKTGFSVETIPQRTILTRIIDTTARTLKALLLALLVAALLVSASAMLQYWLMTAHGINPIGW